MKRPPKTSGAGTGLPPLAADAVVSLRDLTAQAAAGLEEGRDSEGLRQILAPTTGDLAWDLHLIAALGKLAHPGVPGLLAALFGEDLDKPRRKALKRAFHLLKTRCVPVPEHLLPREEAAPLRAAGRGPALAYISQVLGNGALYVILEGSKEVLGGNFLVSLISDKEGIQECHLLSIKSRQRQEFWDQFHQQGLTDFASPPPAYAVRLLEEAQELKPDAEGASRYRSFKPKIFQEWGRPEDAPNPEDILPALSPGDQSRFLDQSRDLVLNPLFHSWLPGPEEIEPWLQKLKELQESPLVLSDQQRQARVGDLVDEATRALYPPEARDLWRRRLLTMAYFLDLRGQGLEARLAESAAQDLAADSKGPLAGENHFLKALVWESLKMALEFEKHSRKEAASPSNILAPPTESLLIRR